MFGPCHIRPAARCPLPAAHTPTLATTTTRATAPAATPTSASASTPASFSLRRVLKCEVLRKRQAPVKIWFLLPFRVLPLWRSSSFFVFRCLPLSLSLSPSLSRSLSLILHMICCVCAFCVSIKLTPWTEKLSWFLMQSWWVASKVAPCSQTFKLNVAPRRNIFNQQKYRHIYIFECVLYINTICIYEIY